MDVKYINPFVSATQTVFKSMLALDVKMEKPIAKEAATSGDVTGYYGPRRRPQRGYLHKFP